MTPIRGLALHVYHTQLFSFCYDFEGRQRRFEYKNPAEVPLRLRLFKMVVGPLPPAVAEAVAACEVAYAVYDQTSAASVQSKAAFSQAEAAAAYDGAADALDRALVANWPEMLALHERECPDCPWDGETIFSKEAL